MPSIIWMTHLSKERKELRETRFHKGISPIKILPLGFLAIIVIGALLLLLPCASHRPTTLLEALFTATSASCVTGLVLVDTGTHFTLFGQIVILFLIQLGGLGFMTASSLMFAMLGKKVSLKRRMTIAEGLGEDRLSGVVRLGLNAVKLTALCEGAGAVLLAIRFVPRFGWAGGLYRALFHSISAFCNAGFDLMGNYASLTEYVQDPLVCFTVMALIITGGLGFAVLNSLFIKRPQQEIALQKKLVLYVSGGFFVLGGLLFFLFECGNPATLGGMGFSGKLLASLFQSVTCRTAGFNTVDQAALTDASKLLSCILMFIGGAPAGTAGGIKVTTVAVLFLTVQAHMRGRQDTEIFGRRLSVITIRRAICIFMIGVSCVVVSLIAVSALEGSGNAIDRIYELFSAIGTVGLTAGFTAVAGTASRCILMALMFTGRVGILTLALSLSHAETPVIRYPEGNIMVG